MARALDAGSGDTFTGRTSELRGKDIDPQPNRVGFNQDYLKTTPQQCPVAFKCVYNKSVKTTLQQCPVAFKCVYNKSGLLSNEWMKVCEKETVRGRCEAVAPTSTPVYGNRCELVVLHGG